jgi:hypothetical protein
MANPSSNERGRVQHPTEVFEEEMAELEKSPAVKAWSSWLAGLGAVTLLFGIVLLVMAYDVSTYKGKPGIGNVAPVELDEPIGEIDHLPSVFRWEPVEGADSYLVTVTSGNDGDAVLVRPARGASLSPGADDLSVFGPGEYRWTVDARGADGKTKAFSEGSFQIRM